MNARARAAQLEADDEAERQERAATRARITRERMIATARRHARAVASLDVTRRVHLRRQRSTTDGDVSLPGDGC